MNSAWGQGDGAAGPVGEGEFLSNPRGEGQGESLLPSRGVLLVSPWYRPVVGGVVEVADRLFRLMNAAGVQTHLMVCNRRNRPYIQADPAQARLWHAWVPAGAFCRPTARSVLGLARHANSALRSLEEFIVSHEIGTVMLLFPIENAWPFIWLKRRLGLRLISSYHGNDICKYATYARPARWLCRKLLSSADALTACAPHLATLIGEVAGRPLPVEIIGNCVDGSRFTLPPPDFVREDPWPTFLHMSNFSPKKRVLDIVQAFADPRIPGDSRLVMVGDGSHHAQAVKLAGDLGLGERVRFVGSQKDVRPFLWSADIFLLASDDEGAPLALLEAMACGLPYVSTPWGVAAEAEPGLCGLVVPIRSPWQLAGAMASLIRDRARCRQMGLRGRRLVESRFTQQAYVGRHLNLIKGLERAPAHAGDTRL